MSALDAKLFRDLLRLWAQVIAIALVVGGGFTTLVAATGSFRYLDETRAAYYERHQFADVFATVRRAPKSMVPRIKEIPGVAVVEVRISELALLDIPGFREPASGRFISLPDVGEALLNRPYMRVGRLPETGSTDEVVDGESFAIAQGFELGIGFPSS